MKTIMAGEPIRKGMIKECIAGIVGMLVGAAVVLFAYSPANPEPIEFKEYPAINVAAYPATDSECLESERFQDFIKGMQGLPSYRVEPWQADTTGEETVRWRQHEAKMGAEVIVQAIEYKGQEGVIAFMGISHDKMAPIMLWLQKKGIEYNYIQPRGALYGWHTVLPEAVPPGWPGNPIKLTENINLKPQH